MDVRLIFSVEELELLQRALDSYKTGITQYTDAQIEKLLIYIEKKTEEAR